MLKKILSYTFAITLLISCSSKEANKEQSSNEIEKELSTIEFNPEKYKSEDIVFYNLFSPVDLTYLVTESDSYFNSSFINALNNITKYNNSTKLALNLGVYGADFSYLIMYKQSQQAYSYLSAIQRISEELSIPKDNLNIDKLKEECNSADSEELIRLARESYHATDKSLKESGRENIANLVLLGGWIETLYIAVNMHNEPDSTVISRVAMQQFSLNNLYQLLLNYQDNANMTEYIILMKKLKNLYANSQITFPQGSLQIDTVYKRIQLAPGEQITLTKKELNDIRRSVNRIRSYIVD